MIVLYGITKSSASICRDWLTWNSSCWGAAWAAAVRAQRLEFHGDIAQGELRLSLLFDEASAFGDELLVTFLGDVPDHGMVRKAGGL
ncbi:hypothetical protein [Nonomuraea sp. CA-141351]|uniref:hypothetical protein n=1 Tax=Nonomuraea sp. CA-141351 TaxID=3239996 RepID=UPI003D8D6F83